MKDQKENRRLAFSLACLSFAVIEFFCLCRYWFSGKVDFVNNFKITENWILELPLRIPRLIDGIIVGALVWITIFYLNGEENVDNKHLENFGNKRSIFFAGLAISLSFSSFSRPGLILFLFIALLLGLFLFLASGFKNSLSFVSGLVLTAILFQGSVFGLSLLVIIGLLGLFGFVSNFYLYEGVWAEKFEIRREF